MSSKRAVVTGAAGFLGSHLTDRLLGEGHTVIGVDNFSTGEKENIAHLASEPRFRFEERDICQPFGLDAGWGPVDYVFQSGLLPPVPSGVSSSLAIETLRVGSAGVENTLEIASRYGAGYLHASHVGVLRRPAGSSADGRVTGGNVNPSARAGLRRSQAFCRGDDDGLPSLTPASTPASSASLTPTARACA